MSEGGTVESERCPAVYDKAWFCDLPNGHPGRHYSGGHDDYWDDAHGSLIPLAQQLGRPGDER